MMYLLHWTALSIIAVGAFYSMGLLVDNFSRYLKRPANPPTVQQENILVTTNSDSKSGDSAAAERALTPLPLIHQPRAADIPQHSNTIPQLYALVIGINDYPNLQHLKGAVPDADLISEFLTIDLGVPPSHITNLRDSTASRSRIIQEFQALRNNDQIKHGSPILIYFAGHGGVGDASEEWKKRYGAVSKIQVIFPYDYGVECEGGKVNCIPDKTIAGLLNGLAKAKGDNITVIFDSCHSASANRAHLNGTGRQARSAPVGFAIPADIDDDILLPAPIPIGTPPSSGHGARHASPLLCSHQTSHTYLAACGSEESAWEADGQGEFTTVLLKQIRACRVDKITYQNLTKELPWLPKQTPHCYGAHKSRILFNACVPSRRIAYTPVLYDPARQTLTLQAGIASGVTRDSVWEVRVSAAEGGEGIVGRVKADAPCVSRAALTPEESLGGDLFWSRCEDGSLWEGGKKKLYARQIKSGPGNELKVWFSPEAKGLIFPEHENRVVEEPVVGDHEVGYVVLSERNNVDIAVELYQPGGMGEERHPGSGPGSVTGPLPVPEVVFHLCDPQAEKYGVATLRQRTPARRADVETVLFAAARWNWHLKRTNPAPGRVEMEMFKVAEKNLINGEYSDIERSPVEGEWVNLNKGGVVDFEVHEKDLYGVRLKSQVKAPLYVWMFYFDTTTFAIDKQFEHCVSNSRADPNISPRGELILGDDADGDAPLHFELNADETLDLGYMKIFWSTEPLELDHLVQESAFETKVGAQSRKPGKRLASQGSEWGSVLVTLVQRMPTGGAI